LVTTETGTMLSAAIASGSGGSLLTSSASVVNGIATFNQLALVGVVETPTQSAEVYRLKFEYGALSSSPSAQLSVMHNVADRISIVRDAADGRSGLIFDTTPQVVLLDRFGNRVFRDPAVTIIGNPQVVGGAGSAANVNNNQGVRNAAGVYTFQMGISGLVGNTYEISASDGASPTLKVAEAAIATLAQQQPQSSVRVLTVTGTTGYFVLTYNDVSVAIPTTASAYAIRTALEGTAIGAHVSVAGSGGSFEIVLKYPSGYYVNQGEIYVPPHVNFKLCDSNVVSRIQLPIEPPFRSLGFNLANPGREWQPVPYKKL
jgi:hypothetical protein